MEPFPRYKHIIDDYARFCEALDSPLPLAIWTNPQRISPRRLAALLRGAGFDLKAVPWYPGAYRLPVGSRVGKRWEYFAGLCHIQEEAALLPVKMLDPRPGEYVLDMCASPGNKTAQIASAMKGNGTVVANELNSRRLPQLRQNCERLGYSNVALCNANGTNIPGHSTRFDRILVDAPCSCEGTTRKAPNLPLATDHRFTWRQHKLQCALMFKAAQLCKVGGRIVYATCTYAPEENEMVVESVLNRYGSDCLRLVDVEVPIPRYSSGLSEWDGHGFCEEMTKTVRVWPHQNDTGGFFVAVFEKVGEVADYEECRKALSNPDIDGAEDAQRYGVEAVERFGVPPNFLGNASFMHGRSKQIYMTTCSHSPPEEAFSVKELGVRFVHKEGKHLRLTHPGALMLAPFATRNVVTLNAEELQLFLERRSLYPRFNALANCAAGTGYVLMRHQGVGVGLGSVRVDPEFGFTRIRSNFPKAWAYRVSPGSTGSRRVSPPRSKPD